MSAATLLALAFEGHPVRTAVEAGAPWFCAKDVCTVLGYANDSDAVGKHCRPDGVAKRDLIDSLGRTQEAAFLNEGNLYRLILRSKKPEAEKFERWVMDEVLPSIRRTGAYAPQPAGDPLLMTLGVVGEMRKEQLALEERVSAIEAKMEAAPPEAPALPARAEKRKAYKAAWMRSKRGDIASIAVPGSYEECEAAVGILSQGDWGREIEIWREAYRLYNQVRRAAGFPSLRSMQLQGEHVYGKRKRLEIIESNGDIWRFGEVLAKMAQTSVSRQRTGAMGGRPRKQPGASS